MQHTIVMTGASGGIGRIAAEHILRRSPDAHLLVGARGSSGARLAAELAAGGNTVSHVPADLGSLESVRSAATQIRDRLDGGELPPLRGFVGNAGRSTRTRRPRGPTGSSPPSPSTRSPTTCSSACSRTASPLPPGS